MDKTVVVPLFHIDQFPVHPFYLFSVPFLNAHSVNLNLTLSLLNLPNQFLSLTSLQTVSALHEYLLRHLHVLLFEISQKILLAKIITTFLELTNETILNFAQTNDKVFVGFGSSLKFDCNPL